MKPSCHRSSARATHPELLANSSLLGPIGSSKVPLVRKSLPTLLRTLTVIQSGTQRIGEAVTGLIPLSC